MNVGTVTRVDRAGRLAYYLPHPLTGAVESLEELRDAEFSAAWIGSLPPCPLTEQYITNDGAIIIGPVAGPPERIVEEHFTVVDDGPTPGTGDNEVNCDEHWIWTVSGGGTGATFAQAPGVGLGVLRNTCRNQANNYCILRKNLTAILPSAAEALWVPCRFQLPTSAVSINAHWGLADSTSFNDAVLCRFISATSTVWDLFVAKDGVSSSVDSALTGAVDGFHTGDIVYVPGEFAALWLDGDGPYTVTTNVPDGSDSMTLWSRILTGTTASKSFDLDFFNFYALPTPVSPQSFGLDLA